MQDILENCCHFDRDHANIATSLEYLKYLAFDAPVDYYAYSQLNVAPLASNVYSFEAPRRETFLGTAKKNETITALPDLNGEISPK